MTAENLYEVASTLRSIGLRLIDIASELYPSEYEQYLQTRDLRLYNRLVKRVYRLIYYHNRKCREGEHVSVEKSKRIDLALERDPLGYRERLEKTLKDKFGKNGAQRQYHEYEQLLYRVYSKTVKQYDPDGVIWATVKSIHGRCFYDYYAVYQENVWIMGSGKARSVTASYIAYAYVYSILFVSLLVNSRFDLKYRVTSHISKIVPLEKLREWVVRILPLVLAKIM